MRPPTEWADGWADNTPQPSSSGVPPLPSSSAPRPSDVAESRSANINQNDSDIAASGSRPEMNVAALQGRPSHEEIGRRAPSGERNEDARGASSPATAPDQWSRKKPRNVWPSDSQVSLHRLTCNPE